MVAFNNHVGIMAKNGYSYANGSPFFEDGRDGRTSQRYTVRGAVLIGNKFAVRTIAGPTKAHVEASVIAAKPPADLYPAAAADAIAGKELTELYQVGIEGKHLPMELDTWAITLDDATMAVARKNGFGTRPEVEKTGVQFNAYGAPSVCAHCPRPHWRQGPVMFLGNVNKFYQRQFCGNSGKSGKPCYRAPFEFSRPAPAVDEVDDVEEELEAWDF